MSAIDGVSAGSNVGGADMSNMSLEALYAAVMVQRNLLLDSQVREILSQVQANNEKMQQMQQYLAEAREALGNSGDIVDEPTWTVEGDTIHLDNDFSVTMGGDKQEWTITGPDGNETRIWGDPHVDENGDGTTDWDFKEDVSFVLPDGTNITVGTKDWGNGMTVTDSLTITKGNQSIQVTGIADNNPQIGEPGLNGFELDAQTNDGQSFYMGNDASEWHTEGGDRIEGDQAMGTDQTIHEKEEDIPIMSEEMKKFLDDNGISYPESEDGTFSADDWSTIITNMEGFNDSLSSLAQLKMVQLQSLMGKRQQGLEWHSNETSKFQGTNGNLIRNMG